MTNRLKALYKKAYVKCKKQGIPFAHDCREWTDAEIKQQGHGGVVASIIDDCRYWQRAYLEDALYFDGV